MRTDKQQLQKLKEHRNIFENVTENLANNNKKTSMLFKCPYNL